MNPIKRPMLISWAMRAMSPVNGNEPVAECGNRGASSKAVNAPSATRKTTGKFVNEKNGRTSRKALTLRKTNNQLCKSSSMTGRARSLDHLRKFLDHGDGELRQ